MYALHISTGNTKLGMIPALDLPKGITCRDDAPCKQKCYAGKYHFKSPRKQAYMQENLDFYLHDPDGFKNAVIKAAYFYRYFRWHSSGDIVDENYFAMVIDIAKKLSHTSFLLYTKKYELVNAFIEGGGKVPKNLTIVFSRWGAFPVPNPHNFPESYIRFRGKKLQGLNADIPVSAFECCHDCTKCVQACKHSCWALKPGQSIVFDEH